MIDDMQQERRDATTRNLNSPRSPPHTASAPDFTTLVLTSSTSIDQSSIVLASRARLRLSHVVQTGIVNRSITSSSSSSLLYALHKEDTIAVNVEPDTMYQDNDRCPEEKPPFPNKPYCTCSIHCIPYNVPSSHNPSDSSNITPWPLAADRDLSLLLQRP